MSDLPKLSDAPLPSSFDGDTDFYEENRLQKFTRRLKEEPLIPFGVAITCWAFFGAARSIRKGASSKANQFFRYRLYAQSFTLVAMLGGSWYYNADRLKRKEFTDLIAKRKSQEKREAWIRELEARDLEDKQWREKLGKVRDAKREEMEREALEEKQRRDAKSDDGRGIIEAVKGKLKDAKEMEAARQTAEQEPDLAKMARKRRQGMEKKQEVERRKQQMAAEGAGYGKPRQIWGEDGGGLFGWKRIKKLFDAPENEPAKSDKPGKK